MKGLIVSAILSAALVGLARAAGPTGLDPWTGTWSRPASEFGGSKQGTLTLRQDGRHVEGTFDWKGGSRVDGDVSFGSLVGKWSQSGASGTFLLTLEAGGGSFEGTWKGTSGAYAGSSGTWTGKLVSQRALSWTIRVDDRFGEEFQPKTFKRTLISGSGTIVASGTGSARATGTITVTDTFTNRPARRTVLAVRREGRFGIDARTNIHVHSRMNLLVTVRQSPYCRSAPHDVHLVATDRGLGRVRPPSQSDQVFFTFCGQRRRYSSTFGATKNTEVEVSFTRSR